MDQITLNAHAKINLSLKITGKRPDGYHDIVSFMQGTGLHDVVKIEKCSQNGTKYNMPHCIIDGIVVFLCTDVKTIPTDMSNLALKGIKAVLDVYEGGSPPQQLMINIEKKLPVAAGIAGGSGNGAAAMLGLNALLGSPFSLRDLMRIGAGIGADVPFSIFMNASRNQSVLSDLRGVSEAADAAWTSGIGDIVERTEPVPRHVILANPGTGVSTKAAYEAMDAIGYGDAKDGVRNLFENDLERYTLNEHPEALKLRNLMRDSLRADTVLMSGSGPTIAAFYKDDKTACEDARTLTELLNSEEKARVWLTDSGKKYGGKL